MTIKEIIDNELWGDGGRPSKWFSINLSRGRLEDIEEALQEALQNNTEEIINGRVKYYANRVDKLEEMMHQQKLDFDTLLGEYKDNLKNGKIAETIASITTVLIG